MSCSIFLLEWMITLFSSTLEISVAAYIWDQVFFHGEMHMMRVAIAICKIVELKKIVKRTPSEDITLDEIDVVKELKDCAKYIKKAELAKMLEKIRTTIKYEAIEDLFRHITKKLEDLPKDQLMEFPE
jgi:hypothetical protein